MVLSDLAKLGLESGVWIDEYKYQNKVNKHYEKYESVIFSVQCIIAKSIWFLTLLLLPSWKSSWIFQNAKNNNNNMPVKFSKYNHCWKLYETRY